MAGAATELSALCPCWPVAPVVNQSKRVRQANPRSARTEAASPRLYPMRLRFTIPFLSTHDVIGLVASSSRKCDCIGCPIPQFSAGIPRLARVGTSLFGLSVRAAVRHHADRAADLSECNVSGFSHRWRL